MGTIQTACFQSSSSDEGTGCCGLAATPEANPETPNEGNEEDNKPGQKPSEVLRLSQDVTSGLSRTYQRVFPILILSLLTKSL